MMFLIPKLNPLRFISLTQTNAGFDGNFASEQLLSYQVDGCYFQKWQFSDTLKLQILSDFVPTNLVIRDYFTNAQKATVAWVEANVSVVGQTFKVYETNYALLGLPYGHYYAEFSYEDGDGIDRPQRSEAFQVKQTQKNTILLSYKNSYNDLDVIFDTGIEFQFRVEGSIQNELPANDRETFIDQNQNITLLSGRPFLVAKFYLAYQWGVPRWVADKVNYIQSVNQVNYDGVPYQVPSGAEYEWQQKPLYDDYVGGSVEIQPVENNKFTKYEVIPVEPENLFAPMQKRLRFSNVGADFSVPDKFNEESILEKIRVVKRSPDDINMIVGTTPGGNEISQGQYLIDAPRFMQMIELSLDGPTTLYFGGLTGADCDILILYKQTDVEDINLSDLPSPEPPAPLPLANGMVVLYDKSVDELPVDFDLATGLGRENTDYYEFALCDGRNQTTDFGLSALVGWKSGDPQFGNFGVPFSSNTRKLALDNLPKIGPMLVENAWEFGKKPAFGGGQNGYWFTQIKNVGKDVPDDLSVIQRSIPVILIKKIQR